MVHSTRATLIGIFIVAAASCTLHARSLQLTGSDRDRLSAQTAAPAYCTAMHNVGKLTLTVSNYGVISDGYLIGALTDCFTGLPLRSAEYPKGSGATYMFAGAIWVGAIKGNDTLVSAGHDGWYVCRELNPDESPAGDLIYKSTLSEDPAIRDGAVSEQDFIGIYTDTFTAGVPNLCNDYLDHRPHTPLPIQVTQRSYAWSEPSAEDFVLLDCTIRNIGPDSLRDVYIGLQIDGDVMGVAQDETGYLDDIAGFMKVPYATENGCTSFGDSIPVAWIADNDGEMSSQYPCRSVTGVALLRIPVDSPHVSFNWWIPDADSRLDYGPYRKANYRDFQTGGSGVPEGDRNKYFVMRNGEIDFDEVYTRKITGEDTSWAAPDSLIAEALAGGSDARYLLSFGPLTLAPGDSAPFTFAYVGGENFHTHGMNADNLPDNPDAYMANLDFSDFATNVRSAAWLFDNPGVDTDGDAFLGPYVVCGDDTIYVKGDNTPDFTPWNPPPCCVGHRGNVTGGTDDTVDLVDLSLMVSYLVSSPGTVHLPCYLEADVNARGIVDLSDVCLLATYLTSDPGSIELPACP